ncbi:MAG: hypothetical protein LBP22_01100 [Deltaproteobacteria bacterium]|nr:hypothetical protein [Deltaproteobacteria bacterium]
MLTPIGLWRLACSTITRTWDTPVPDSGPCLFLSLEALRVVQPIRPGHEEAGRYVDQACLACIGLPLLGFILCMAGQHGLKGRDDLHGSVRWAAF